VATRLVVGLGNPGPEYADTRHNLGFRVVERLAEGLAAPWSRKGRSLVARAEIGAAQGPALAVLARPQTFMNLSGRAARELLEALGPEAAWLVVSDDFHLPLGRLRCRASGSDGGHNGLASVIEALPGRDVPRLRMGIGEPPPGCPSEDYVLQPFKRGERAEVQAMVERTAELVREWLGHGDLTRLINATNAPAG
jgi:PTH1 family peptidyl-tRNA hydrolase